MALSYNYTVNQDVHTLGNPDTELTINYQVTRVEGSSSVSIKEGLLLPETSVVLPITLIDGKYRVNMQIYEGGEIATSEDFFFIEISYNLLNTIIEQVEHSICKCCHNCDDCDDDTNYCDLYLSTTLNVLSFTFLNNPRYTSYLNLIADSINENITEKVRCSLINKMINGEEKQQKLLLTIIGIYYLAFYVTDILAAVNQEEANYIKLKYNYTKISKCLKKIGIDVDETNEIFINIENVDVYFWQLDNGDTLEDLLAIFNDAYLDNKPSNEFAIFEEGKIVNYVGIGRVAFAIKQVANSNFLLYDQLNLNITDEFDIEYISETQTALFVSKELIAVGGVYYKFKNIDYGI